MKGLSIGDFLVIQEVQRKDYGRSPGLSRALTSMGITDMYTHRSQRYEHCDLPCMPIWPSTQVQHRMFVSRVHTWMNECINAWQWWRGGDKQGIS